RLQSCEGFVFLFGADATLFRRAFSKLRERFLNPGKTLVEILLIYFQHGNVESGHRGNLRNAGTHKPTTKYAYFFDFHINTQSTTTGTKHYGRNQKKPQACIPYIVHRSALRSLRIPP